MMVPFRLPERCEGPQHRTRAGNGMTYRFKYASLGSTLGQCWTCGTRLRAAILVVSTLGWCVAGVSAPADHPTTHVHGQAELMIAVDGPALEVVFESPLDNLVGFERPPRTERQREAMRALGVRLREPQRLFQPTAAAECEATGIALDAPGWPGEWLNGRDTNAGVTPHRDGHAHLAATYSWRCAAPQRLQGIEVHLMDAFPTLRRVQVQVAGPRGQSSSELTGRKRQVRW